MTSVDHKTHKKHLQIFFARLAEYGIIIGPEKCQFGTTELIFFLLRGHFTVTQRRRRNSKFRQIRKAASIANISRNSKLLP